MSRDAMGRDWWAREAHDPRGAYQLGVTHWRQLGYSLAKHLVRNHGVTFRKQVIPAGLKVLHHIEHGLEPEMKDRYDWSNPWTRATHPHEPMSRKSAFVDVRRLEKSVRLWCKLRGT